MRMSILAATFETAEAPGVHRRPPLDPRDVNRIKLSWLLRLQWGAVVGQTIAIAVAHWALGVDVPVVALFALVGVELVANAALEVSLRRGPVHEVTLAAAMVFDVLLLTAILALSGGYSNPFIALYLVNVALAAVLLEAAGAWMMLGVSLALFGALFALERFGVLHALSGLDEQKSQALHVQGMWVAFSVSAGFLVYIVQRVRRALTIVQQMLAEERSLSARKDKVASLATLAAGAAHELSTPLSTIAVVVKELQRVAERNAAPREVQEDLRLIRGQVDRCRDILHHMSAQAGENAGEPFVTMTLAAWVETALEFAPQRERVVLDAAVDLAAHEVRGPPRGLARALRGLVKNALQASSESVHLRVSVEGGCARVEVVDAGHGMPADILSRAGEPFFTTKIPGEGMGLGLFLTHTLAEQLGGSLELSSTPGRGTMARLRLPAAPHRTAATAIPAHIGEAS
jgi:two-component system sensor histidine kinase RegB